MYLSDIQEMITASDQQDSLAQLNSYIEAWLSRSVLLNEAEKNFPEDQDINKLIDDYRSSLLLHNYRQLLIRNDLDTVITDDQVEEYYQENQDQFLLAQAICKARIVKIPDNTRRIERFYRNWKKNDTTAMNEYIEEHATFDSSMDEEWYPVDHFLAFLPDKKFQKKDFSKKGDIQKHHETFEYFIKVKDFRDKHEIPPLSYVKDQVRKVIMHQRKKDLLDKIEKNLYQNYLKANKIKVYRDN